MKEKLINYIRGGYAGLNIVSWEEARVEAVIKSAAEATGFRLYTWSLTSGIVEAGAPAAPGGQDPFEMLDAFVKLPKQSILICLDFHMFLAEPNPLLVRKIKDALISAKASSRVLVIVGCQLKLPPELEKEITVLEFKLPDKEQLRVVLEQIAADAGLELNGNTEALLDAASGLTTIEAENAYALSVVESRDLTPAVVAREKASTIRKNGVLEIVESTTGIEDIGGLKNLKAWVSKRRLAFGKEARAYGLPNPRGFLMVGIPGAGKSLTAKATANILGVPLLKLDAGRIFGSLVGESERNLRTATQTAEAIAPCVLWCDEIEKGFSGSKSSGATDGGTSARVFGSFLQWMQEKTAPVFVVATANDISQLPPEFLRKGRFDENWFIDLPDESEREAIWRIQITKYRRHPDGFDLPCLAQISDGWTGAEIESLFTEALFNAFDQGKEPTTELLTELAKDLVPLGKMMSSQIEELRRWANGRARRASPRTEAPRNQGRKILEDLGPARE